MPCCLVSFTPQDEDSTETLDHLIRALHLRMRDTDGLGWLSPQRVGILLPYTDADGGWTLANDVCRLLPDRFSSPFCEVFHHPSGDSSDWEFQDRDNECSHAQFSGQTKRGLEGLLCRPLPVWKRGLDIVGSCVALIAFFPLFVVISIVIKMSSRGPILFSQLRSGLGGRRFRIHKFRSMIDDAEQRKLELFELNEQDGPAFKMEHDPRVTRIGRVLRKTSLDELPQIWNVLKGDMTFVGPRPLPCNESDACEPWHKQRLDVTPGLTCIWQVHGRSKVTFDEWMRMDLRYLRRQSIRGDLGLILRTISVMVFPNGK